MSEGLRCLTASLFLDAAGGCDGLPDAQAGLPRPRSVAADDRRRLSQRSAREFQSRSHATPRRCLRANSRGSGGGGPVSGTDDGPHRRVK